MEYYTFRMLTQTTGNLAALRMLVVHGGAFAVAAVADIRSDIDVPTSASPDACAFLLGIRAQLRLYSAFVNASFDLRFVTCIYFLIAGTLTFLYHRHSEERFYSESMNPQQTCGFQYFQSLPLPSTTVIWGFLPLSLFEWVQMSQRSLLVC